MGGKPRPPSIKVNLLGTLRPAEVPSPMRSVSSSTIVPLKFDDSSALDHLTTSSRSHLCKLMESFAAQVVKEAKAIEQNDHAGKGPPEVTAAHIEEAWWVTRRRVRRARNTTLLVSLRAFETLGAAGIGVGMTNYHANWGIFTFMACLFVTCAAYVLEMYAVKTE